MAMDKDILGLALYNSRNVFSNLTTDQLIATYGTLEAARLAACKAEAEVFINHVQAYAKPQVPGAGLTAGATAVTGTSVTGSIL